MNSEMKVWKNWKESRVTFRKISKNVIIINL